MPIKIAAFSTKLSAAAWRDKLSYVIIATEDHEPDPAVARRMAIRAGSKVMVLKGVQLGGNCDRFLRLDSAPRDWLNAADQEQPACGPDQGDHTRHNKSHAVSACPINQCPCSDRRDDAREVAYCILDADPLARRAGSSKRLRDCKEIDTTQSHRYGRNQ